MKQASDYPDATIDSHLDEEQPPPSSPATIPKQEDLVQAEDKAEEPSLAPPLRRRLKYGLILVLICCIAVAVALSIHFTKDDDDDESKLLRQSKDIIERGLGSGRTTASNEKILETLQNLTDLFLTECPAGVMFAVTKNGERLYAPGGVLTIEDEHVTLVDENAMFEVGSVSKPLTALVVAQQILLKNEANHNHLTLDTPINDLLPDSIPPFVVQDQPITLRHLVAHTAGIPRDYRRFQDVNNKWERNVWENGSSPYPWLTEGEFLEEIAANADLIDETKFGTFQYSSLGYWMLAYALEEYTNTSFPELKTNLMHQLGLNHTYCADVPDQTKDILFTPYIQGLPIDYWYDDGYLINGGGATVSSAWDLLTLAERLMNPLDSNENDSMTSLLELSLTEPIPGVSGVPKLQVEENEQSGMALGWFWASAETDATSSKVYWHTGKNGGSNTHLSFQPYTQSGLIAWTNCGEKLELYDIASALLPHLYSYDE